MRTIEGHAEYFVKKLTRVHEGLAKAENPQHAGRTLFSSLGKKWPFKRTMSAPMFPLKPGSHISYLIEVRNKLNSDKFSQYLVRR